MARATPRPMNDAKRTKAQAGADAAAQAKANKITCEGLLSIATALHAEVDKLARKGPEVGVSELTLAKTNRIIRDSVAFLKGVGDQFVDEIVEFVSAGDMPEYRDVVLVLAEVKAGLERYEKAHRLQWNRMAYS